MNELYAFYKYVIQIMCIYDNSRGGGSQRTYQFSSGHSCPEGTVGLGH